jgi:hypothetical protein
MLENRQRCGGHFTERRAIVVPGESSGDGPFEQRHAFLGGNRSQQRQDPLLFYCLNDDQRVAGTNEDAEIMYAG